MTLNQVRHLSFTAPEELRARLKDVSRHHLAARTAALRPGRRERADPVLAATLSANRLHNMLEPTGSGHLARRVADPETRKQARGLCGHSSPADLTCR